MKSHASQPSEPIFIWYFMKFDFGVGVEEYTVVTAVVNSVNVHFRSKGS